MRAEVRPAIAEDLFVIARDMRQSDRDEVAASHGHSPEDALVRSFASSTAVWTGLYDGEPVIMFGVAPISILGGRGSPWMLGTTKLEAIPRTFLRHCRRCVAGMLSVYPWLENYVDDRNTVSIKWLGWLGFTVADEPVALATGAMFRHFEMRATDV